MADPPKIMTWPKSHEGARPVSTLTREPTSMRSTTADPWPMRRTSVWLVCCVMATEGMVRAMMSTTSSSSDPDMIGGYVLVTETAV